METTAVTAKKSKELWKRFKKYYWWSPALELGLDPSRMSFGEAFLKRMEGPMAEAFAFMRDVVEGGGIANPDEGRRVGHYWLRAPELAPSRSSPRRSRSRSRVKAFAADVHAGTVAPETAGHFRNVLLIGIGGSALGPQLVSDALGTADDRIAPVLLRQHRPRRDRPRVGPDRAGGLARTLTIVVSKSGGTKETRNGMLEAQAAYRPGGSTSAATPWR